MEAAAQKLRWRPRRDMSRKSGAESLVTSEATVENRRGPDSSKLGEGKREVIPK